MYSIRDDPSLNSERRLDRKLNKLKELNQDIENILESFTSNNDESCLCNSFYCEGSESDQSSMLSFSSGDDDLSHEHYNHHVTLDSRLEHLFHDHCTIKHHIINPAQLNIYHHPKPPKVKRNEDRKAPLLNKAKMSFSIKAPPGLFGVRKSGSVNNLVRNVLSNSSASLNTKKEISTPKYGNFVKKEITSPFNRQSRPMSSISHSSIRNRSISATKRPSSTLQSKIEFKPYGKYKPDNPIFLSTDSSAWENTKRKDDSKKKIISSKSKDWKPTNRIKYTDDFFKSRESIISGDEKIMKKKDSKFAELESNWKPVYRGARTKESDEIRGHSNIQKTKPICREKSQEQKKFEELERKWKPAYRNNIQDEGFKSNDDKCRSENKESIKKKENQFEELERKWKPSGLIKHSTYPTSDSDTNKNIKLKKNIQQTRKSVNVGDPTLSSTPILTEDPAKGELIKSTKKVSKVEKKDTNTKKWTPSTLSRTVENKAWLQGAMIDAQKEYERFKKPVQNTTTKKNGNKFNIANKYKKNDSNEKPIQTVTRENKEDEVEGLDEDIKSLDNDLDSDRMNKENIDEENIRVKDSAKTKDELKEEIVQKPKEQLENDEIGDESEELSNTEQEDYEDKLEEKTVQKPREKLEDDEIEDVNEEQINSEDEVKSRLEERADNDEIDESKREEVEAIDNDENSKTEQINDLAEKNNEEYSAEINDEEKNKKIEQAEKDRGDGVEESKSGIRAEEDEDDREDEPLAVTQKFNFRELFNNFKGGGK